MRKYLTIFFIFSCLIFSISVGAPIQIEQGKYKEIYFEIENKNNVSLYYTLYSVGGFRSVIFQYSQVLLQPNEHTYIKTILFPEKDLKPGVHNIELVAQSRLDKITKNLEIDIKKKKEASLINLKEFLFDNKKLKVAFDILDIYDLRVELFKNGKLIDSFEQVITPQKNEFFKNLNLEAGNYIARVSIYKDNTLVYTKEKSYAIVSNIIQSKKDWNYLITYGSRIEFYNKGNVAEEKEYSLYVDKSRDPFFFSTGYYSKEDLGNKYKYTWKFVLLPNQHFYIPYSYNYSIILVLVIAIIFLVYMLYWITKKELKLKKTFMRRVVGIKENKEITILLEVVNKTKREITNLVLEDYIPPIFKLSKEFPVVKPNKIVEDGNGKKIVWEIVRIEPKETRVFTYKIIPKIGIKGRYVFPLAKLSYKIEKVKKRVFSNSLKVK